MTVKRSDADARTPLSTQVGWAFGDFGFNIYWQALNLLMMPFYTDVLGLDPVLAGTVFLLASLWDGFADSVIGAIADRTRSKHGSYRPYLVFASPVMVVAFMIAFFTPDWEQGGLFLYALLGQVFLRTAYSLVSIPYSSLSSRISTDSDTRSAMAGWRMVFAMLGGMTVTFLMPSVVDALSARTGNASSMTYVIAAGMAGIISLPVFWITFISTREPPAIAERAPSGFRMSAVWEDLRAVGGILRHNRPLLCVFGCMIVSSLAFTMTNKCMTYYVVHYLERPDLRQYILPTVLFVQLVFCPVWAWLARIWSKRRAWLVANCVSLIAYLAFYLSDSRDPAFNAVMLAGLACGNAAYITLVWAMLPDTVEYTEWKTGERHDAKIFGVASFAKQLALGVNGFLLGALLSAVGYAEKSDVQTDAAIDGLKLIMSFVPLLGIGLSAIIISFYTLDRRLHGEIQLALRRPV